MWIVLWLACGVDPAPATSRPIPPTADLTPAPKPEPQWSNLDGLLPPEPGLPLPVRGLFPGLPAPQALEVLSRAAIAGTSPKTSRLAGRTLYTTPLEGFPMVQVTAVLTDDGSVVDTVQINLPSSDGEAAMVRQWGPASGLVFGDGSDSQYVWTSARHSFHWKTAPDDAVGLLLVEPLSPSP